MGNFLDTNYLPMLNHYHVRNLNKFITPIEIQAVIKILPNKRKPRQGHFVATFYLTFTELMPILLKLTNKIETKGRVPNLFYELMTILIPL